MKFKHGKQQRGFTLIELAIVLVIVTILIGGLAVPLSAQIEARRVAETRKTMDEAREAIFGYAMTHKTAGGRPYLPCPDTDGDGRENRVTSGPTSTCPSGSYGLFPWADLGTAAEDAWGNRLHYGMTQAYGDEGNGFSNASVGDKQVCGTSAGGCSTGTLANKVPVVLVSYGPNGWGGHNVSGSTQAAPTSADELENTDNDDVYVSRAPTKADASAGEFDDLAVWISSPVLISRVCPSGGCP